MKLGELLKRLADKDRNSTVLVCVRDQTLTLSHELRGVESWEVVSTGDGEGDNYTETIVALVGLPPRQKHEPECSG